MEKDSIEVLNAIDENFYDNKSIDDMLFLYDIYLFNMLMNGFFQEFISPAAIEAFNLSVSTKEWNKLEDKYLMNSEEDKAKFANDINRNGTFWELLVKDNNNEYKYKLTDGSHRLYILQALLKKGQLNADKFLVTDITKQAFVREKYYFIIPLFFGDKMYDTYSHLLANGGMFEKMTQVNISEDNSIAIVEMNRPFYHAQMFMSYMARNAFYDYSLLTGLPFKGSDIINSEEVWKVSYGHRIIHESYFSSNRFKNYIFKDMREFWKAL